MKHQSSTKIRSQRAFTLIEVLMVVATIGVLAGSALYFISGAVEASREKKLQKDVVTLNAALKTFQANGGSIDSATTSAEIIELLKTNVSEAQKDQLVGIGGSMIDPRIVAVDQTTEEAATTDARVLWDATEGRFVIAYAGAAGIKRFKLDESKSADPEIYADRELTLEYATKGQDKWVWEYADHGTAGQAGPGNVPVGGNGTPGTPTYTPPSPLQLDPPEVSIPGGLIPLMDFEGLEITLNDPNPSGVSQLFYSVVPGVWERYAGPISVEPGTNLETQSVSLDPDNWTDSDQTTDDYRTDPVKLEIEADFFRSTFDYVSLGGALETGSPSPTLAAPGEVTLTNAGDIPERFQNDAVFEIVWTS